MSILWLVAINLNFTRLWVPLYLPGVLLDRISAFIYRNAAPELCHKPRRCLHSHRLGHTISMRSPCNAHAEDWGQRGAQVKYPLREWWRGTAGAGILSLLRVHVERYATYAGRSELPTHLFHAFLPLIRSCLWFFLCPRGTSY
ncbi:hypothetical protein B0H13DRAFT_881226 [Mycena leptocephala]|nr:hypothetical protein B0H13DRAFT_881226 [Mycena leptocephala]